MKKEPSAITIGNLKRELHNALQRCDSLMLARDNYQQLANQREITIAELRQEIANERQWRVADVARLTDVQIKITRLETHIEGYRMAVADFAQPEAIPRVR